MVVDVLAKNNPFPGEPVRMPDLAGMTRVEAEQALIEMGLYFRVEPLGGTYDLVQEQSPTSATRIPAGTEVRFSASCTAISASPVEGADVYDPCSGASWLPHPYNMS